MQIDCRNFQQHIDLVLQEIDTAHFVSFDCEFTGLVTQLQHIEGLFPDHREFYERIKETALNFNLLQLGITLFHFQNGEYLPKSYNFYVSGAERKGFNKVILSEWDSMAFLARNGMNFSTAFRYGIQYKRIYGDSFKGKLVNPLEQRQYGQQNVFFSPEDRATVKQIEQQIQQSDNLKVNFKSKRIFDFFRNKYEMSFDKPRKNMQRYEYSIKIYPKINLQSQQKPANKISEEETVNIQFQKVEDVSLQEKEMPQLLTLQTVIAKIIECGKPIVGHFPNLDLGLIYHSFIAELPQSYEQFTNQINQLFPYIFDTKVISRRLQSRLKSIKVDLKSLYKACFSKKLLEPYANLNFKFVEEYVKTQSSHEAGYDSFMTGCAFIAMLNFLYDVKQTPFVFANAQSQNKMLYSKFAGEISLCGPVFSQKTDFYQKRIVIFPELRHNYDWQELGRNLSEFGTLQVYQDHCDTYFFFDDEQKIEQIMAKNQKLRLYSQRKITLCRKLFP